jgi:CRISPR-associated endonuclease/helicase Cas3
VKGSPSSHLSKDRAVKGSNSKRFDRLLAKSSPAGQEQHHHTLQGHTGMVVAAAHRLLETRGAASLAAVGLSESFLQRLRRIVLVAAFAHDLGKCSAHFQEMVRRRRRRQLVRHEAATLWLAWPGRPLSAWLTEVVGSEDDLRLALCAAAGHHRKFWSGAIADGQEDAGREMPLLVDHPDFRRLLESAAKMTGLPLPDPPVLGPCTITESRREPLRAVLTQWQSESTPALRESEALLAVAKALVLDADVAGSAIPRSGETLEWITEKLTRRRSRDDLVQVVERRLNGGALRPFQTQVASATAPITLVIAGCGSGKTVAAYQWAANQHPGRQLWITYPTTGTATEGYRDYVADPELEIEARLEHSRAVVDLEMLSPTPEHEEDVRRDQDRLEALRFWEARVVTCTADTVLGLVQNQRKGLYAWASLASAAIVFDEIHAYDDRMFAALLRFLTSVPGIPVLLMTASLPSARRAALESVALNVHRQRLEIIPGPPDLESIPRYVRCYSEEPWSEIESCLNRGGKVLYVSNTVDRCRAAASVATARGIKPRVYHSRFRYRDRVSRHGEVIDAFRHPGGVLAVTTQVAEMSLDLSADLLVSDLAPVSALIQRLGRLNRRASPGRPAEPKPFIVLEPDSSRPYESGEMQQARAWLERLGEGALSQADLVAAWADAGDAVSPGASAWLDGGFSTEPAELREPGVGIQVLLANDAAKVREGKVRAVEVALPMPPPPQRWLEWSRLQGYVIPPEGAVEYDEQTGARWV